MPMLIAVCVKPCISILVKGQWNSILNGTTISVMVWGMGDAFYVQSSGDAIFFSKLEIILLPFTIVITTGHPSSLISIN